MYVCVTGLSKLYQSFVTDFFVWMRNLMDVVVVVEIEEKQQEIGFCLACNIDWIEKLKFQSVKKKQQLYKI